jgi:hypothetical protein
MDIVTAFEQVGTYRGAAALCGTTHKTVKRVIDAQRVGEPVTAPRWAGPRNTDAVKHVIDEKVKATDGRISAKRLLPIAQAAGYTGSARSFRRAAADRRPRRLANHTPGHGQPPRRARNPSTSHRQRGSHGA